MLHVLDIVIDMLVLMHVTAVMLYMAKITIHIVAFVLQLKVISVHIMAYNGIYIIYNIDVASCTSNYDTHYALRDNQLTIITDDIRVIISIINDVKYCLVTKCSTDIYNTTSTNSCVNTLVKV